MSSSFEALENSKTRARVLVAAGGLIATIVLWAVHLSFPHIVQRLFESDRKFGMWLLFAAFAGPPFAAAFSIGSMIMRRSTESVEESSGPMSGYFYRERANKEWKLAIVAGLFGGMNFMLLVINSASDQ
ncbi:MAG TPA: hypothetical protein VFS77_05600 [Pyrinomonadaceae bacterium]|nr:hypothetical protein [Pyrinomonadaceae bacterium]